jgi:hypothetical protein
MRALKITEADGLFTVETSAGVRATGATLTSAMDKLLTLADPSRGSGLWDIPQAARWMATSTVFESIRDSGGSGIVRSGQAGA